MECTSHPKKATFLCYLRNVRLLRRDSEDNSCLD